ncbi:MAG: hypothetical protein Q8P91_02225 [bacterium]|nr:hypothetical protein [bacterium]
MNKIIFRFVALFLIISAGILAAKNALADSPKNLDQPAIYPQRIISWGNSGYHDSLGARDPYAVKDNGTYYLYYDCIEDLLNPSFESKLGTNG